MKKILLLTLTVAVLSGCERDDTVKIDEREPVFGEADAVTEVETGPVDDTLVVDEVTDEELDPTYVPEEESVEGDEADMTEGEMLEPEGE